jgi:hypothetical protein
MEEPVRLADMIVGYWVNFVKTGDPNGRTDLGQELPHWPSTRGGTDADGDGVAREEDLVLRVAGADDGNITLLNKYHDAACEYWANHWEPFDAETCRVGCFGGCIPCDGERPDPSEYGEPTGGAC